MRVIGFLPPAFYFFSISGGNARARAGEIFPTRDKGYEKTLFFLFFSFVTLRFFTARPPNVIWRRTKKHRAPSAFSARHFIHHKALPEYYRTKFQIFRHYVTFVMVFYYAFTWTRTPEDPRGYRHDSPTIRREFFFFLRLPTVRLTDSGAPAVFGRWRLNNIKKNEFRRRFIIERFSSKPKIVRTSCRENSSRHNPF